MHISGGTNMWTNKLSDKTLLLLSIIGFISFSIYWLFLYLINTFYYGIWPEWANMYEWIIIFIPIILPIILGAIAAIFSFVSEDSTEKSVKRRIAIIIGIVDVLLGVLQITWMMIAGLTC